MRRLKRADFGLAGRVLGGCAQAAIGWHLALLLGAWDLFKSARREIAA